MTKAGHSYSVPAVVVIALALALAVGLVQPVAGALPEGGSTRSGGMENVTD